MKSLRVFFLRDEKSELLLVDTKFSDEIVKELFKIKPPFNINKIAEIAAVEALKDQLFISKSIDSSDWKSRTTDWW